MSSSFRHRADERPPHVEITVVESRGSAPREPGARMYWYPDDRTEATIGGGNLEFQAVEAARKLWNEGGRETELVEFPLSAKLGQCCGGWVRVFLRRSLPAREVLICGAGHVATALAHVLGQSPFRVTVVDSRDEWARAERFPSNIEVRTDEPEAAVREWAEREQRTSLLIMTHRHDLDEALCRLALRYRFAWIGLIGSRTKWRRFHQRLSARGFTPEELARITCPIGDPGLGKDPREIAISVAAQLLRVHHGLHEAHDEHEARASAGRRAALILAGGASSRMGRWKGGLPLDGEPLVRAHAEAAIAAGAEIWKAVYPVSHREEAEKVLAPAHRVLNPEPKAPLFASLQLGLRALVREAVDLDSVMVVPVDMIPLDADWLSALWDRHEASGSWATRPRVPAPAGSDEPSRHGHPVILDQRLIARLLTEEPDSARLDHWLRDFPADLQTTLDLPSPDALSNLNTPEDYRSALGDSAG